MSWKIARPGTAPATTQAQTAPPPLPAAPPAAAAPMGPGGDTGSGFRVCAPNDTMPVGTVVDGYRKNSVMTLFGPQCRWEPVGKMTQMRHALLRLILTACLAAAPFSVVSAQVVWRPTPNPQPQPEQPAAPQPAPPPPAAPAGTANAPAPAPQTAAPAAPPAAAAARLTDSGGFLLDNVSLTEMIDILAKRLKINYILGSRGEGLGDHLHLRRGAVRWTLCLCWRPFCG